MHLKVASASRFISFLPERKICKRLKIALKMLLLCCFATVSNVLSKNATCTNEFQKRELFLSFRR
uniref:Phlebovirus glycoprotein G2 fusion domain-containing protein n=1 Tax=Parascaris univalens TaxID=6257 RepID=A0A915AC45_PARUN